MFTNYKVKSNIIWSTRKIKSLFNNKDNVKHMSCIIYYGVCSCGQDYVGETIRNASIRWNEHNTGKDKNSDCAKHLKDNYNHEFSWKCLSIANKCL